MTGLSKSLILAYRQCPRRLWLHVWRPELEEYTESSRVKAGGKVGEVARALHPDGLLIEMKNLDQAAQQTEQLLQELPRSVFEGTFIAENVAVRIDLMIPDGDGFRIVEVKSSSSVKDYQIEDAAVQTWVVRRAGWIPTRVAIAHIDTSFVYPGGNDYQGLFREQDVTAQVDVLDAEVSGWVEKSTFVLEQEEPEVIPGTQCHTPYDCPFISYCSEEKEESSGYPPEDLPYGRALAAELRAEGYNDLREVPEHRLSNPRHLRILQAVKSGTAILEPEAQVCLVALPYPRYYLDFETILFPVPIWRGTRPYQQIPFQWSCHVEYQDGCIEHQEFLAAGQGDPRREFSETLISAINHSGPIIVYNAAFERARMKELAQVFPDIATLLIDAVGRIFDLLPIARDYYYHPDMHGSWSIKAVLPTIAPELSYDDLEVADGGMAMDAFARLLDADTPDSEREQIRDALLRYCQRDTLAMVRIAHYFQEG